MLIQDSIHFKRFIIINIFFFFLFKYDLGQKYHVPQVRPNRGSNSLPPDRDSTVHVTEMPALTTRPSVTSKSA